MKTLMTGALTLAFLFLSAPHAQGQIMVGPHITMAEHVDFGIGVAVETPLASIHENLEFGGAFTLFFPDHEDYWEMEGAVRYLFHLQDSPLVPFAMAGLGFGRVSWEHDGHSESETHTGLLFGGGIKAHGDRFSPFGEIALGVGDLPDWTVRGGLAFTVGGETHH